MLTSGQSVQAGEQPFFGFMMVLLASPWTLASRADLHSLPTFIEARRMAPIQPPPSSFLPFSTAEPETLDHDPPLQGTQSARNTRYPALNSFPWPRHFSTHSSEKYPFTTAGVDEDSICMLFSWDSLLYILHRDQPPILHQKYQPIF